MRTSPTPTRPTPPCGPTSNCSTRSVSASEAGDGPRPLEVSLKLSALGSGAAARRREDRARERPRHLHQGARRRRLGDRRRRGPHHHRLDAVDRARPARRLRLARHGSAGLPEAHRGDCEEFAASGARIRLCKGAYDEPASVAYRDGDEVTDSYLRCLRVLMAGDGLSDGGLARPGDHRRGARAGREFGRGVDDFEYQMLYGIRDAEQRRLADDGNHVRVYVPFGTQWYGYFVRRLAERPANLTFFLRALAERRAEPRDRTACALSREIGGNRRTSRSGCTLDGVTPALVQSSNASTDSAASTSGSARPATGICGARISANASGARSARTTAPTATPGPTSRTTTPDPAPTAGVRTAWPAGATSNSDCAWRWRCGTAAIRPSRSGRSG